MSADSQADNLDPRLVPDIDTHVAIRVASTVMILRDSPSYQVLIAKRSYANVFGPGVWVFPGGRLDPEDFESTRPCDGSITAHQAQRMLSPDATPNWNLALRQDQIRKDQSLATKNSDSAGPYLKEPSATQSTVEHSNVLDARGWWIAAIRETYEETGLEIARNQRGELCLSELYDVARFITPVGPPRRYDTRFFLYQLPESQPLSADRGNSERSSTEPENTELVNTEPQLIPDRHEILRCRWVEPQRALEENSNGQLPMMSVTRLMMERLATYCTATQVCEAASKRNAAQRVRALINTESYSLVTSSHPQYDVADEHIEQGWTRI